MPEQTPASSITEKLGIPEVKRPIAPKEPVVEAQGEESVRRMLTAVGTFLGDVARADTVAKKALGGNTAIDKILKGAAVTGAGVGLEMLAEGFRAEALGKIIKRLSSINNLDTLQKVASLLNNPILQEMVEDISVFMEYKAGNAMMDKALPDVKKEYIIGSAGVDLAEAALRKIVDKTKQRAFEVKLKDEKILEILKSDGEKSSDPHYLQAINFSNPVTLFGIHEIWKGAKAYGKALVDIRTERAKGGTPAVERLLWASAKVKTSDEKMKQKAEKLVKLLEDDENGRGEKHKKEKRYG